MKKFIVLIGLLLITGLAKAEETGKQVAEFTVTTFEVNGTKCELRTIIGGDFWTQCPSGYFVEGARTINVRPPFASTIVRCAKYEIRCEE